MITGIIELKFIEDISDEDIQKLTSDFYFNNKSKISGMEFKQLKDEECLIDCHRAIRDVLGDKSE